jgi:group I intron endonuclease
MYNNLKRKSGIYIIKNTINKKVYIGSSANLYNRIHEHIRALKNNKHKNSYLQNHYNKYINSLYFECVCFCDKQDLIVKEQYYIDLYESFKRTKGFNINEFANSMFGFKHTEKTKENWSKKRKGVLASEETKKRMSLSKTGSNHSRSKLNENDVINIRNNYDNKRDYALRMSIIHNVSWSTINYILKKRTWKHI